MRLRVHREANGELMEALGWLVRRKRYEVARRLNQLWLAGLDAILDRPITYPMVEDPAREMVHRNYLIRRYGYRIIYEVCDDEIHVLAFARGRRNSGHWHDRVTNP
ncbi:MAG: type II toxin-antitoxin system RelE/ParE family toxin [Gemmataceae bacterium]